MSTGTGTGGDRAVSSEPIRSSAWGRTAVAGAVTFLAEYVVLALLFVFGPVSTGADTLMERLTSYAFVLFSAHHAPVVRSAEGVNLPLPPRENLVTGQSDPTIPIVAYLAIPVVALLIAGATVEWRRREAGDGLVEGSVLVGTGLAAGYVVVGMVATFVFVDVNQFDPGHVTQSVDRLAAFVVTLGYPLVFGTVGALAVRAYRAYA